MSCPMDYSFCNQKVTVYRKRKDQIIRQELDKCYFSLEETYAQDGYGQRVRKKCRLIIPGKQKIFAGDRVYPGVGPQIGMEEWQDFLPANVPGLCVLQQVKTYFWENTPCHTEGC